MEKLEYIDGLVNISDKEVLCVVLKNIVMNLRSEGFYDDDIYEYLNNVSLKLLHQKYEDIINQLKK
jgi:hypothetical protein